MIKIKANTERRIGIEGNEEVESVKKIFSFDIHMKDIELPGDDVVTIDFLVTLF